MRIASWNVNSVKQRLDLLRGWLAERQPDLVALQETKCVDEAFPREALEDCGYNVATVGQKSFNGVAILSKLPIEETISRLPGDDGDAQARFLEAVVSTPTGVLRFASIYLPNGNPPDTDKYPYKLAWFDRLIEHARARLACEEPLVLTGDYNVIPMPVDARDPAQWVGDALFLPPTRERYRRLLALGFVDALRASCDASSVYTFWDYQAGAWQKDNGIRIDHVLLSPEAADRLTAVGIDRGLRGRDKPSDHVPVWAELDLESGVRLSGSS